MKIARLSSALCFVALSVPFCFASPVDKSLEAATDKTPALNLTVPGDQPASLSSSSQDLPNAPSIDFTGSGGAGYAQGQVLRTGIRPFSAVAIGVKIGAAGAGFEVAVPLANKLNLRGSASFFGFSPNFTEDGIVVVGSLSFKTVNASVDYFPFGGSFHISPGVTLYNGNHITANAGITGGQSFTLNDVSYISNPQNPVTGTFDVAFGNKVAPSLTVGFGNIISRNPNKHWSVPFEIGFEYIGTPQIALSLSGSACQNNTSSCQPVQTTPSIENNVKAEQNDLNNDISGLQIYPIVSIGVAYKFGPFGRK